TLDRAAQKRMESALWALHSLYEKSPQRGTLVRFVRPDGGVDLEPASKDTYTGFFYGVAQSLPYVRDPALRKALQSDLEGLANHFLAHHFSFVSIDGPPVDMSPYPDEGFYENMIQGLSHDADLRRQVIRSIQWARWYFWLHGQSAPASFARFSRALKHPEDQQ